MSSANSVRRHLSRRSKLSSTSELGLKQNPPKKLFVDDLDDDVFETESRKNSTTSRRGSSNHSLPSNISNTKFYGQNLERSLENSIPKTKNGNYSKKSLKGISNAREIKIRIRIRINT